jgi:hypothetical protein
VAAAHPPGGELDTIEGRIVNSEIVMEQKGGGVIDRPDVDVIEIRWFDTTFDLRTQDFKQFLDAFATEVERTGRRRILTDAMQFLMDPGMMVDPWREADIIPRYNASGFGKFAFLVPADMPSLGEACRGATPSTQSDTPPPAGRPWPSSPNSRRDTGQRKLSGSVG